MTSFAGKTKAMLVILVTGAFLTVLNQTLVAPALPTIMREFQIDATTGQWLTTGFMLVNAIMIPITAFMQERFSIRSLFVFAMLIFATGSALCGWGPYFQVLLAGRMIQAIGAGVMMPMSMAVMLVSFPLERRGSAMGIIGTVFACAPAIGPCLSGFMVAYFGWHIMFWGVSSFSLIVCIIGFSMMEKKLPEGANKVHLDISSVLFSTFGLACLLYGLSVFGSSGLNIFDGIMIVAGIALVCIFCYRQNRLEHPMLQVSILKCRDFTIATTVGMIAQASVVVSGVLIPIYVQTILGYNSIVSGLTILPGSVISAFLSPIAGKWYDKHGPRKIIIVGLTMLLFANLLFGFLQLDGSPVFVTFIFIIRQIGIAMSNMTSTTWGMSALDDSLAPHASGVNNTLRTVAASLGTAIVVSVSAMVQSQVSSAQEPMQAMLTGINVAYLVLSAVILFALILAIIFIKDIRPNQQHEDVTIVDEISDAQNRAIINAVMKLDVFYLKGDDSIKYALHMLVEHQISGAPVVDDEMHPIGFFSDGDFLKRLATTTAKFDDPLALLCVSTVEHTQIDDKLNYLLTLKVSDLCVHECICASSNASIGKICRVLSDHHLKKIPITSSGKVIGIINRSDITKYSIRSIYKDVQN